MLSARPESACDETALAIPGNPSEVLSAPLALVRVLQVRAVGDVDAVAVRTFPRGFGAGAELGELAVDVDAAGHGVRAGIHAAKPTTKLRRQTFFTSKHIAF